MFTTAHGYAGETTKWTGQPGGVYKWQDKRGQVHYTQYPPMGVDAVEVKEVEPSYPTRPPGAAGQQPADIAQASGEKAESPGDAKAKEDELKRKNCNTAKKNLVLLQSKASDLSYVDNEGNTVKVDDKERAARLEAAKQNVKEYCQ